MPANVSTMFACSARCSRCASATSALACRAAAPSTDRLCLDDGRDVLSASSSRLWRRDSWSDGDIDNLELPAGDEGPGSSEKMRPIVERGFWIVLKSPVMAGPSSRGSPSLDEGERGGVDRSPPSIDGREPPASPAGGGTFSPNVACCVMTGDVRQCFSAMAETAASTFLSNSSSDMVSDERSMFSTNWTAPIWSHRQRDFTPTDEPPPTSDDR